MAAVIIGSGAAALARFTRIGRAAHCRAGQH
jgi:hypothetical protein